MLIKGACGEQRRLARVPRNGLNLALMVRKGAHTLSRAQIPHLHRAIRTRARQQVALHRIPREPEHGRRVRIRRQWRSLGSVSA